MTDDSRKPASGAAGLRLPPLYPIIDLDLCRLRGVDPLALAEGCLEGGARLLQVRQKSRGGGGAALLQAARAVVARGHAAGARVIVNDRADLAAMAGADGVHIGQQDLPASAVRALLGPAAVVGISTHSPEQVDEAAGGPADYIAVGPIFVTTSKDTGYEPRGLGLVRYAARTGKPVVAIGGISAGNAAAVLEAGAASVAVISELLSGDPAERVRAFVANLPRRG